MKVAIRADASELIGTGHLMRCLVLADALAAAGAETTFLWSPSSTPWRRMIEARGHRHVTLPVAVPAVECLSTDQRSDAAAVQDALSTGVDLLVVDHYGLDHRWEELARLRANQILAIDDLAN